MVALFYVVATPWCEYLLSHNFICQHFVLSEFIHWVVNASDGTKTFREKDYFCETVLVVLLLVYIDLLYLDNHLFKLLYLEILIYFEANVYWLIISKFGVILLEFDVAALWLLVVASLLFT